MVNERPKNSDKVNDPEAIVNRYDLRDRKCHTLNSKPTHLNTAQKDSKSTVSEDCEDCETAKELLSPPEKKGTSSDSPPTAREQPEGANNEKTDETSEQTEFTLSNSKPTQLNTAQKDSKFTVSENCEDCETAKELLSPPEKKGTSSDSPPTAREQPEGANNEKTNETSEQTEFGLSNSKPTHLNTAQKDSKSTVSDDYEDCETAKELSPTIFFNSMPAALSKPARNTRSASPKKPTNPIKDVIKFLSDYANKFAIGSKHTVDFFLGSYEDAQRKARNDGRLLVIFIHDPNNADSTRMIHETLNTSEFDKLVTYNKLIVWGIANDSEEGRYGKFYPISSILHVFKFPFISLMCPRADNRKFPVERISGFVSAADLVEKLESSIQTIKDDVKKLRKQKKRDLGNRLLREKQDREYEKSEKRDKPKVVEARKARIEKEEAKIEERRKQKDTEERRKAIAVIREQLRQRHTTAPPNGETVNIQVRFPSGERFAREFGLDDSLEELFSAILCHEACPDFFMVLSGYPRTQVPCTPVWYHLLLAEQLSEDGVPPPKFTPVSSFRDAGMTNAVAVFVTSC